MYKRSKSYVFNNSICKINIMKQNDLKSSKDTLRGKNLLLMLII